MRSLLFVLMLLALAPAALLAQDPCAGGGGRSRRMLYDYRQGVDLAVYNLVAGRHTVAIVAGADQAERKNEAQRLAWANAFDKIDGLGLSYRRARTAYWEGYKLLRRKQDQSILSQEIKIYQETELVDLDACEYIYVVELAVPSVPSLEPLSDLIRELVSSYEIVEEEDGRVKIDLDKVLEHARKDDKLASRAKELMKDKAFVDALKYRDDDTQRLVEQLVGADVEIKISRYQRGQYRVNAFIGSLIKQAVVPRVEAFLGEYDEVTVTCWGYTDPLKVSGIPYRGYASFGRIHEELDYTPPDVRKDPRDYLMRSNAELSVARAYEGIQGLAIALREQAMNPRLTLRYAGGGEIPSAKRDRPESRKIIYIIEYRNR